MELIERFNDACKRHDTDAAFALCAEGVVFESTGPAPDGERFVGKAAVRAVLGPILSDPSNTFEVEETLRCGDWVAQRSTFRWEGGHVRGVDLLRVQEGLIVEMLSYVKG